jgi:hypothetical protein
MRAKLDWHSQEAGASGGNCVKADSARNCVNNRKPQLEPTDTVNGDLSFRRFGPADVDSKKTKLLKQKDWQSSNSFMVAIM